MNSPKNQIAQEGTFFFLFAVIVGTLFIFISSVIHGILWLRWVSFIMPNLLMFVYSFHCYHLLKNNSKNKHLLNYADSVYFLGFVFTLISLLFCLSSIRISDFGSINLTSNGSSLPIFNYIAIAFSTTIVGIISRHIIRLNVPFHMAVKFEDGYKTKLNEASQFSKVLDDIAESLQNFSTNLETHEHAYFNNISNQQNLLINSIEKVRNFNKVQIEEYNKTRKCINDFSNTFLEANKPFKTFIIQMSSFSDSAKKFSEEVDSLQHVIDGLISVLENKVNTINEEVITK